MRPHTKTRTFVRNTSLLALLAGFTAAATCYTTTQWTCGNGPSPVLTKTVNIPPQVVSCTAPQDMVPGVANNSSVGNVTFTSSTKPCVWSCEASDLAGDGHTITQASGFNSYSATPTGSACGGGGGSGGN
jgi:hypothetical protein